MSLSAINIVTLVGVGYLIATTWWTSTQDTRAPVMPHAHRFIDETARAGDSITLEVDRTRVRYCPGMVDEFWRDDSLPARIVQGERRPASPSRDLGRLVSQFSKQLPESLTPGRWCYEPIIRYTCEDGTHIPEWPAACVDIVP